MKNRLNKNLTWRELNALHKLYTHRVTRNKIQSHPYIKHLLRKRIILNKFGSNYILEPGEEFDCLYKTEFEKKYIHYYRFLEANEILTDCSRYSEDDIQTLMLIKENQKEIIKNQQTRRTISSRLFKGGSKHLEKHPGLEKAVLKILGIKHFPEQDQKNNQCLILITCKIPKLIVLCENLDFLKLPWKAREYNITLWHAGGNNIEKLNHIPKRRYPIYYSADWDYDGLRIYQRVKKNYIAEIKLLYPDVNYARSIIRGNHRSRWNFTLDFSGLDRSLFSNNEINLIEKLIDKNEWIEEETNDLIDMLQFNRCI